MKVNFNVYFKDFDGSVLLIDKETPVYGSHSLPVPVQRYRFPSER